MEKLPLGEKYLVEVAVPYPLRQSFTYLWQEQLPPGIRVLVLFRRKKIIGITVGNGVLQEGIAYLPILQVLEPFPVLTDPLLKLGFWMADYYFHPLGEVLSTMLPVSKNVTHKEIWTPSSKSLKLLEKKDPQSFEEQLVHFFFGEKKSLSRASLKTRLSQWNKKQDQQTSYELASLIKTGLFKKEKEEEIKALAMSASLKRTFESFIEVLEEASDIDLTKEQQQALDQIIQNLPNKNSSQEKTVFLIHGITGSGKTEIYLQSIAQTLKKEPFAQTIMLVPEISLTPQMTRVFSQRFGKQVGVVHSAMKESSRRAVLNDFHDAKIRILIGPRSAVFAPCPYLRLIIVDEEHDSSYKQSSGLLYHGRDVAVLRGRFEQALVLLGSATPSMESLWNAKNGRYGYLKLVERAKGGTLPDVKIVSPHASKIFSTGFSLEGELKAPSPNASGPISEDIFFALEEVLAKNQQSIIIVNRRGFASYLLNVKSREPEGCPNCSISLTFHKKNHRLLCHYCGYSLSLNQLIADKPSHYLAMGFGTQHAEELLKIRFPKARIARLDTDVTAKKNEMNRVFDAFTQGKIDFLVGTQLLAKGHDFPLVTLTVLCDVDQTLNFPDLRAGEKTFQLLVQAAGRSGRGNLVGKVIIQTARSQHPVIQAALKHDYDAFAKEELSLRKELNFPPISKMVCLEWNSTDALDIAAMDKKVELWLKKNKKDFSFSSLRIIGPMPAPIEILRGRHRRLLTIQGPTQKSYKAFIEAFLREFNQLPSKMRLQVDVDPQNLL